jgi:hypothetical protein
MRDAASAVKAKVLEHSLEFRIRGNCYKRLAKVPREVEYVTIFMVTIRRPYASHKPSSRQGASERNIECG